MSHTHRICRITLLMSIFLFAWFLVACGGQEAPASTPAPAPPSASPTRELAVTRVGPLLPEATPTPMATPAPVPPLALQPALLESASSQASNVHIEYILDASGSMLGQLSDHTRKRDVAKEVLARHLPGLPPQMDAGLRVFGRRLDWRGEEEASCEDIELIAPVQTGQGEEMAAWLQGEYDAQGMTPLAQTIRYAVEDLPRDGGAANAIVLISSGGETCGGDPCAVVKALKEDGYPFTLHVVGMDVGAKDGEQLLCMSRAGEGYYIPVHTVGEIDEALTTIEQHIAAGNAPVDAEQTNPDMIVSRVAPNLPEAQPTPETTPVPVPTIEVETALLEAPDLTSNVYVEYILDASGSMRGQLADHTRKRDVAEKVLSQRLRSFPPQISIGFRVFGHHMDWRGKEDESCKDIELIAPVQTGQLEKIATWLDKGYEARGMTPLAQSIRYALEDMPRSGEQNNAIVLISDGKETCGGDPCAVVEKLKERGIHFTLHVVGMNVAPEDAEQLMCVARAGEGYYIPVQTVQEMNRALETIEQHIAAGNEPVVTDSDIAYDFSDATAIVRGIQDALERHDTTFFESVPFLYQDTITYLIRDEMGQSIPQNQFLSELSISINSPSLTCDHYAELNTNRLNVWTSGWVPPWKVTETCHGACVKLSPPFTSDIANFSFVKENGIWRLKMIAFQTADELFDYWGWDKSILKPCAQPIAENPTPTPPPTPNANSSQIVFFTTRNLPPDECTLFTMNEDGTSQQPLFADFSFQCSDGNGAFWYFWDLDYSRVHSMVLLTNPNGQGILSIDNTNPTGFVRIGDERSVTAAKWSPDGKRIAYVNGFTGVYVMDADGGNVKKILDKPDPDENGVISIDWSPDGSKLAVNYTYNLYLVNPDGSDLQRIFSGFVRMLSWSPDSKRIAFENVTKNQVFSDMDIWIINRDGSNPVNLTKTKGTGEWNPTWSADGKYVYFNSNGQIYSLEIATGRRTHLTFEGENYIPSSMGY